MIVLNVITITVMNHHEWWPSGIVKHGIFRWEIPEQQMEVYSWENRKILQKSGRLFIIIQMNIDPSISRGWKMSFHDLAELGSGSLIIY